jgi:hypothetical protein
LPAVDVTDGGASRLIDIIIDHIGDFKKWRTYWIL